MRRFFVDKISKPTIELKGNERRHLADVLRARVGERVILCPGDGKDYTYKTVSFAKDRVTLAYVSESENTTEPFLDLCVFCALLKGDKTEFAVQKLTELGVKRIQPFVSEYTVQRSEKKDRLVKAAHEAAKQCGRAVIPEIGDVVSFDEITDMLGDFDKTVFAYEAAYSGGTRMKDAICGSERSVALVVGPEGGFSKNEAQTLVRKGYSPVTLGKRILRAETASVAAAAVILYMCGEWE